MRALLLTLLLPGLVRAEERLALVVSGGISLGAYQGGVLFARLKSLQNQADTRLEIITGASAGAINAWLGVVAACDARRDRMALFANPFFDIWTNVGLDVLLPVDEDGAAYAGLLAAPLGSARVARLGAEAAAAPHPPGPFEADGHPQGLLTRSAFGVVGRYLVERLADDGYRDGCALATAVTLTETRPTEAPLAAGEATAPSVRAVVPLRVRVVGGRIEIRNDDGVLASGQADCLRPGVHPWEACHPTVGRTLALPEAGGRVSGPAVVRLVQGASAFPVAFSPVPMTVCTSRGEGAPDPACPGGLARLEARFIDGGFFDNVPLGPAVELAHDADLTPGPVSPLAFLYIDPDLRRGAPRLPEDRRRADGLGAFTRLVNQTWREARAMELQGLERHCARELSQAEGVDAPPARRLVCGPAPRSARTFRPSSRFHGITGRLAGSFGAFFHRAFRVHDYLVGVYDGVHGVAEATPCDADPDPAACRVRAFRAAAERVLADFDAPRPEGEHRPRRPALVAGPATADDVRGFLYRLFVQEHRALDPAAAAALCAEVPPALAEVACGEAHRALAERSLVWALHVVYADLDARLRASVLTADLQHRLQQAALETSLERVLRAVEPSLAAEPGRPGEVEADRRAWLAAVVDRLARRALAVERADAAALAPQGEAVVDLGGRLLGLEVTDGLQLARTAAAAALERDDAWLDFDAGTTRRVVGDHAWVPLLHLLPHYLAGDPLYGGIALGSSGHLRLRALREPGRNLSFFQKFSLVLDGAVALQDTHPVFQGDLSFRLGAGLGFDPDGRLVDDLDLVYVQARPLPDGGAVAHGLELSGRLGTKLRLAVGTYDLSAPALYFTVGLADWLALLVGSWAG